MLRFIAYEGGRLVLGLVGAAFLAAAVASAGHLRDGVFPFFVAWGERIGAFAALRFGDCAISGSPILTELSNRLPVTGELVVQGAVAALLIGVPVGFAFAFEGARRVAALLVRLFSAVPTFCLALALSYLATNQLHWHPQHDAEGWLYAPRFLLQPGGALLPVLTIGLAGAAAIQAALRRVAENIAEAPWRNQMRRMGLSRWEIEWNLCLPLFLGALLAHLGELAVALLSATAVAEWVFSLPGAADLFVKSIALQDWTAAGAVLFVFAGLTLAAAFAGRCTAQPLTSPFSLS